MAKKVGAIVSLSIIGILIIATIIMANVKVDYGIKCGTPDSIVVKYGSKAERVVSDVQADSIIDIISNACNEKSLTALFNGNLGKKATVVLDSTKGKTLPTLSDGFYVRYHYQNTQDLKQGNKLYQDSEGNRYTYEALVYTIKNIDGEAEVTVYVIPDLDNANTYTHYYKLDADLGGLYDYLVEQGFNK
ncbi:MAG: hypothetical protein E7351_00385 [Clostridiales bacterium]|nr:hypothetical protein [Clostridiales bacterium]